MKNPVPKFNLNLKNTAAKLSLAVFSFLLFLILFDFLLRARCFDSLSKLTPALISWRGKKINDEINAHNTAFSKNNSFRFNDIERNIEKGEGAYRIAVLGDSLIWGDGLAYDIIWSHKLEKKIKKCFENTEVLSWGRRGWSTLDEFNFLEKQGIKFNLDLLVVGFFSNDPDMGEYKNKFFRFRKTKLAGLLKAALPGTVELLDNVVNKFMFDYWKNKLYSVQNLRKYKGLLVEFSDFCRRHNIKLLFVLTPGNYSSYFKNSFAKITPLLKEANIEYLNLYPAVARKLSKYKSWQLRANLANVHPGDLVTEVFADEVFEYLVKNKLNKI